MQSSELVKYIRSSLNLTQSDFADSLGITQQEVSKLETGNCKITLNTLMAISTVHSISLDLHIYGNTITIPNDTLFHFLTLFNTLSPNDQKLITDFILRLSTNTSF